ncbi:MAG: DUF4276 family protein [Anaerolineales bacterium]|nr:DUF4276 family protein [Anaerolineales bacterium]
MLTLVPIIEGDGEVSALPLLLRRLFLEVYQVYDVRIVRPKNAHGCGNLTATDQIERFVTYALLEPECDGVLVLIDNDAARGLVERNFLDDDCAPAFAHYLAERVRAIHPTKPVAIVVARWEYEAWFLASLETVGAIVDLPEGTLYEGEVESERSAKGWIGRRLPPGRRYSETRDQARMTAYLDLESASRRSRSFRRLRHALEQLVDAKMKGGLVVTPLAGYSSDDE